MAQQDKLIEQLRTRAQMASEASRIMAGMKDGDYERSRPEDTIEGKAADALEKVLEALRLAEEARSTADELADELSVMVHTVGISVRATTALARWDQLSFKLRTALSSIQGDKR